MTVLCPRQTPKLSRLTASPQVLITAGTRIITCVSRVLHVFTTCVTRGCPWAKFWAVQNFLPRPTPFRFFSASCHVYKSTVARLKLDINANNIVCFTGDNFLTGFGRDQAVKRCVTGPLDQSIQLIRHFPIKDYGTIRGVVLTPRIVFIWQWHNEKLRKARLPSITTFMHYTIHRFGMNNTSLKKDQVKSIVASHV